MADIQPAERAWIRIMRVYQQIDRKTATLMKSHGLSVSRFDVLNHAGVRQGRTQQQLADAMFVTKGNICQLLDGMEADGLLFRRRQGRENHIYLTDTGSELRDRALGDQRELIQECLSVLTTSQQDHLQQLLRAIDHDLTN